MSDDTQLDHQDEEERTIPLIRYREPRMSLDDFKSSQLSENPQISSELIMGELQCFSPDRSYYDQLGKHLLAIDAIDRLMANCICRMARASYAGDDAEVDRLNEERVSYGVRWQNLAIGDTDAENQVIREAQERLESLSTPWKSFIRTVVERDGDLEMMYRRQTVAFWSRQKSVMWTQWDVISNDFELTS